MLEQSFAYSDIPRIITLAFLELLLSADNAIVLSTVARNLPSSLRRKALFIGIGSAFFLRVVAIALIASLLEYVWVQLLGAAYLIYLSIRYFTKKHKNITFQPIRSFWKTVLLIELLDLVFAIDSIVAGVAFIDSAPSKLYIVYIGGMIGLLGMRYAANIFSHLLEKFPQLETSAYLMIGLIGLKLALNSIHWPIPTPLFWAIIAASLILGFLKTKKP